MYELTVRRSEISASPMKNIMGTTSQEVKVTEQTWEKVNIQIANEPGQNGKDEVYAIQEHQSSAPMAIPDEQPSDAKVMSGESPLDPLKEAQELAAQNRDRWLRAVAELENYKKRTLQEKSKLLKYRNEELLRDLLPVVDNLHRALSHSKETGRSDGLLDGLRMIADMFRDILIKCGVKEIEALGSPFDPQFHEALARVSSPGSEPNLVIEEMEKGYMYHDRLLRPAKVVVSA